MAPGLWRYEFGKVLGDYFRQGKITQKGKERAIAGCPKMLEVFDAIDMSEVARVAEEGKLKFYDASYVWLARHLRVKLFTRDRKILMAFPLIATKMPKL